MLEAFLPQPWTSASAVGKPKTHKSRGREWELRAHHPGLERGGVRGGEGFSRAVDLIANSFFIFVACRLTDESETTMDGWSRGVFFFSYLNLKGEVGGACKQR